MEMIHRRQMEDVLRLEYLKQKQREEELAPPKQEEPEVTKENVFVKRPKTAREHVELRKALISK